MLQDVFDQCPGCKHKTFLRTRSVYQCPKCLRFFCSKCSKGNLLFGYRCPSCTFHIPTARFPELRTGYC